MKFFGVIVLLVVAASCQAEHAGRTKRATINENLIAMVESFRETMKTGNETQGIPVLEPYEAESLTFSVDDSMATLDASLTNLVVNGLSEFTIDKLTFSIIGMKFTFGFTFPLLNATGGYSIDGTMGGLAPIYGSGDFDVQFEDLSISGVIQISALNSYLYIYSMTSAISVNDFKFEATGILNDNGVSSLLSAVITDLVPQALTDYQSTITTAANSAFTSFADEYLGTMTLSELLALISG